MLSRRSMLAGMLFAPAVVNAEILMPVKRIFRVDEIVKAPALGIYRLRPWETEESEIPRRLREIEAIDKAVAWQFIPYSKDVVPFSHEARTAKQAASR